jgi:hypothetical protein
MGQMISERELQIRNRLKSDYSHYAEKCLKIRTKIPMMVDGKLQKIVPFIFNRSQHYIHEKLEAQKAKTGKVRALLLKGRQQGSSTYVGGRFYNKVTHRKGAKAFILAHMEDATTNLFKMVQRYHEHCNPLVKPGTSFSNRKELVFDKLDSAYGLGTAGSKNVGRSDTVDFLHGSEVAFWENTDDIKTGIFQAAEAAEEIILESTANGLGNMFHHMWQDAEKGRSDYIAIFVPWYWQPEYRKTIPEDKPFIPTKEEAKYQRAYKLDDEQMYWRRLKIVDLKDPLLFKQEYPGNAAEAFQTTGVNSLISAEAVLESRKTMGVERYGAYVVGCDPAREGSDSTTFIRRQGRRMWNLQTHNKLDDMAKAGLALKILEDEPVDMMFIDRGGGSGMYDRLVEMGFGKRVRLVNFGGSALNADEYKNRRAEMWDEMRIWLESEEETQIPDLDTLQADMCSPGYKFTSTTQKQLEAKSEIKKRIGKSPDEGDAAALTFAEPVRIIKSGGSRRRRRSGMAA